MLKKRIVFRMKNCCALKVNRRARGECVNRLFYVFRSRMLRRSSG